MSIPTYTHVGQRAYVGNYAVTADAHRKPGKVHAMNLVGDDYVGLCGVRVAIQSDDHFMQGDPQVVPINPGNRVTCKRCRAALGLGVRKPRKIQVKSKNYFYARLGDGREFRDSDEYLQAIGVGPC